MAALFHTYSGDDMFKINVGSGNLSMCSVFDDFNGSADNFSIISDVAVRVNENVQFFLTFDDLIHYYHFGKSIGSISFRIELFTDCSAEAPGLDKLLEALGNNRGLPIDVSIGNVLFTGILTDFSVSVMSEPITYYVAQINMAMTDHKLPAPQQKESAC